MSSVFLRWVDSRLLQQYGCKRFESVVQISRRYTCPLLRYLRPTLGLVSDVSGAPGAQADAVSLSAVHLRRQCIRARFGYFCKNKMWLLQ